MTCTPGQSGAPCPSGQPGHRCQCHQAPGGTAAIGVALRTISPAVAQKLMATFPSARRDGEVYVLGGENFDERLRSWVDRLSRLERADLVGTVVTEEGAFDPWSAVPIDQLLLRLETMWFMRVLADEALEFHLQPIVRATDLSIYAYESLVRARVGGALMPGGAVVDAARAHGELLRFDQRARRIAIETCAPKLDPADKLFVNFFPLTVYDPAVCLRSTWAAAERADVRPDRLVFEVVESEAFPDVGHLRAILEGYRARGALVALDDLGTGHTALQYIDELAPDYIKLAKDLIPPYPTADDIPIVRGLVEHARSRGILVLAEGVETTRQLDVLRELGVDFLQGYLLGKPQAEPSREIGVSRRAA